MSNSSELQAANRSEVTNSVVVLVKGKKTKLGTKESAHKITSLLRGGNPLSPVKIRPSEMGREMKHENPRWNPGTGQWFCTKCGRGSDHVSVHDAQIELEHYECRVPSVESPRSEPGTETTRLIRKLYKMTLRTERSGSRFLVASDEGKPVIQLDLFHDSAAGLKSLSMGFELLSGTTLE